MGSIVWHADYTEDGEVAFRLGRDGDELVAEWVGLVRLIARRDGTNPRLLPEPGADPVAVEKVRRGSARLLLRQLEGRLALHGAAVAVEGNVGVLLGRSGQGKSTLAAALCQGGAAELFADDAVALDEGPGGYRITPFERDHWLDAYAREATGGGGPPATSDEGKAPVRAARVGEATAPLRALVELAFTDVAEPRLVARGPMDAMASLVPQVVRFVLDEPEPHRRELEALADLVARVPSFRLERPRRLDRLARSRELVRQLLLGATP